VPRLFMVWALHKTSDTQGGKPVYKQKHHGAITRMGNWCSQVKKERRNERLGDQNNEKRDDQQIRTRLGEKGKRGHEIMPIDVKIGLVTPTGGGRVGASQKLKTTSRTDG